MDLRILDHKLLSFRNILWSLDSDFCCGIMGIWDLHSLVCYGILWILDLQLLTSLWNPGILHQFDCAVRSCSCLLVADSQSISTREEFTYVISSISLRYLRPEINLGVVVPQMNNKSKALDQTPVNADFKRRMHFVPLQCSYAWCLHPQKCLRHCLAPFEAYNPMVISITVRPEGCHDLWQWVSYLSVPPVFFLLCCWIKALSARSDPFGAMGCRVEEEGRRDSGKLVSPGCTAWTVRYSLPVHEAAGPYSSRQQRPPAPGGQLIVFLIPGEWRSLGLQWLWELGTGTERDEHKSRDRLFSLESTFH